MVAARVWNSVKNHLISAWKHIWN